PEPSPRERWAKWRRRNPRLATSLLVGLAATVFLILPVTVLAVHRKLDARDRDRLATSNAEARFDDVEAIYRGAHASLTTRNRDRKLLEAGLADARKVFDAYGIGADPAWSQGDSVARLPEEKQKRLKEIIGDLVLLAARGDYLLSEDSKANDPEGAAKRLKSAAQKNELAKSYFGDGAPRSLLNFQADLLKASGQEAAAKEIRAAFLRLTPRTD